MRFVLATLLLLFAAQSLAWQRPVVNLSRPGALDEIERGNPEHHRLILELIRTVQDRSCEEAARVHKASFDDGVRCPGAMILTSFPAQMHLGFRLGGVDYHLRVQLPVRARVMRVPER